MLEQRFYVVRRGEEWDEYFTLARAGQGRYVCYTTTRAAPHAPCFADVRFRVGNHRLVAGTDEARRVLPGVPNVAAERINWICTARDR
eukprot:3300308-Lingulodinium_polyedra.AAC.1